MLHNAPEEKVKDVSDEALKLGRELLQRLMDDEINVYEFPEALKTAINTYESIPTSQRTAKTYDFLLILYWVMSTLDAQERASEFVKDIREFIVSEFEKKPAHLATSVNGFIPST